MNQCRFRVTPPNASMRLGTIVRTWYPACLPMRKIFHFWFFILLVFGAAPAVAVAAVQATAAHTAAASGSTVSLTPAQARDALAVLNDPKRRAQVADTLQAIAAAGALSAPAAASAAAPAAAR